MCTSHQVTSSIVDTLGSNHDSTLLNWRDALLENNAEVTYSNHHSCVNIIHVKCL